MILGYHIDGFHFDPPNPKNLVFQGIKGEKVIFLRILKTGSPITIPFLTTTFNICMGCACNISRLLDRRFEF